MAIFQVLNANRSSIDMLLIKKYFYKDQTNFLGNCGRSRIVSVKNSQQITTLLNLFLIRWLLHNKLVQINILELRQYKNDIVWSTAKIILKLTLFFTHLYGGRKSAPISKLIWLSTKRGRSCFVFALGLKYTVLVTFALNLRS